MVDAGNRVVLPGFVDAHTHPVFAGNRANEFEQRASGATYAEIAAAGGGIRSTVRQTRAASEDDLLSAAQKYVAWFLENGTTTIEAKSGYGLRPEDEYKLLRVIREHSTAAHRADFFGRARNPGRISQGIPRNMWIWWWRRCCRRLLGSGSPNIATSSASREFSGSKTAAAY